MVPLDRVIRRFSLSAFKILVEAEEEATSSSRMESLEMLVGTSLIMACLLSRWAGTENRRLLLAKLRSFSKELAVWRSERVMEILWEPVEVMEAILPLYLAAISLPTVVG